jgi:hypothetical protein
VGVALSAAAGLLIVACSSVPPSPVGSGNVIPSASPVVRETPATGTTAASRPIAPLTGLPAASAADAQRTAVALDVAGPAPRGLGPADVVFEEIGSPVRYIAVYQSGLAGAVGPITGTQPADGQALSVLHPLIGYDGAVAPFFITILHKMKMITDVGLSLHPSLYTTGPQGVTTSVRAISRSVRGREAPPELFGYRGAGQNTLATAGVSRPRSVRVVIPGHGAQGWVFDSRADRWALASGGPKVQVANLVIQTVSYKDISVSRRFGIIVTSARVIGSGRVVVLSGSASGSSAGTAASGTWSKPRRSDVTNYFDTNGSLMAFQPGPTWVIFAPQATRVSMSGA